MSHTFLEQLWIARYVIMNGIGVTVSISLLAILAGSILGVFVGLALVYGGVVLRLAVRAYTDIIRGTPVLVLVLASYYVSAAVGLDLGPFSVRRACPCHLLLLPCRRNRARSASGDPQGADRSRQGDRPDLYPDLHLGAMAAGHAPVFAKPG